MPSVSPMLYVFFSGAVFAFAATASLLFARFYRRTGDRLLIFFSVAFGILAVNDIVLLIFTSNRFNDTPETSRHPLLYGIRLVAFGLILFAIIDKNRGSKNRSRNSPPPPQS